MGNAEYNRVKRVYFLGVGGIGMSAVARYFLHEGMQVVGYDRTQTDLTNALYEEGVSIHYEDSEEYIPEEFRQPSEENLIVYTPAIPNDSRELNFFRSNGHALHKRAEVLGILSRRHTTLAVAGTHGKTTTTTLLAHLLSNTLGCTAFLGGVSINFSSNLVLDTKGSNLFVVEADEYDRSFLQLSPDVTVITSLAMDHMDIYSNMDEYVSAFRQFAVQNQSKELIVHYRVKDYFNGLGLKITTYGMDPEADYSADRLHYRGTRVCFIAHRRGHMGVEVELGVPGVHNVENALAAIAAAERVGVSLTDVLPLLSSFRGAHRRFEVCYQGEQCVYVDDYAHHPDEIRAAIATARDMFPTRKVTGIFQPHLYTRTRDLAHDFARALSDLDALILLPIYPAREEPIEGVSSEALMRLVPAHLPRMLTTKENLTSIIRLLPIEVLLSMGAGDIGAMVPEITKTVMAREDKQ